MGYAGSVTVPSPGEPPPLLKDLDHTRVQKRWRWWIHVVLITAYPLVVGALSLTSGRRVGPALGTNTKTLLAVVVIEVATFGLIFALAWISSRASRNDLLLAWHPRFWTIPLGLAYSVALRLAVAVGLGGILAVLLVFRALTLEQLKQFLLDNRPDVGALVDIAALKNDPFYFWITVTLVSFLVGGLREELWRSAFLAGFRHVLPARFSSFSGQLLAVAAAALVFGLGHLSQGILAVGLTGCLGFGLGLIMILHRSIWPAVFAHGFFDAASLAVLPYVADKLPNLT